MDEICPYVTIIEGSENLVVYAETSQVEGRKDTLYNAFFSSQKTDQRLAQRRKHSLWLALQAKGEMRGDMISSYVINKDRKCRVKTRFILLWDCEIGVINHFLLVCNVQ